MVWPVTHAASLLPPRLVDFALTYLREYLREHAAAADV
jgi:hypothetical protein